ncbi:MAG: rRNA maturation RNase YbeY [Alistipes sp.]|nr:rRNA maturation RNase YbeY [Alistipes sp.]
MVRYYTDDCTYNLKNKRLIAKWLKAVAEAEGYTLGDITYIFCSSQVHRKMNIDFVGHDYFTDIITFDYSDRKGSGVVSGDIFIDVETVKDNARIYGATARQEMHRVVVHGVLHLCGQGDKTPRTEKQMHRKEDKYLALLDEMVQQQENSKFKIQNSKL